MFVLCFPCALPVLFLCFPYVFHAFLLLLLCFVYAFVCFAERFPHARGTLSAPFRARPREIAVDRSWDLVAPWGRGKHVRRRGRAPLLAAVTARPRHVRAADVRHADRRPERTLRHPPPRPPCACFGTIMQISKEKKHHHGGATAQRHMAVFESAVFRRCGCFPAGTWAKLWQTKTKNVLPQNKICGEG